MFCAGTRIRRIILHIVKRNLHTVKRNLHAVKKRSTPGKEMEPSSQQIEPNHYLNLAFPCSLFISRSQSSMNQQAGNASILDMHIAYPVHRPAHCYTHRTNHVLLMIDSSALEDGASCNYFVSTHLDGIMAPILEGSLAHFLCLTP